MVHLKRHNEAAASSSSKTESTANVKKYPLGPQFYQLYEEVGQGASASVYRALCIPFNEIVAIKILDFEHGDPSNITHEAHVMLLADHPNVLKAHCSFASDQNLWVVMPYMDGGSCLHIMKAAFNEGFSEVVIATILREVLKGLEYLHQHGHIHRDIKAGNILIESHGAIKLGDFGVSASLFDSGDRQRMRNTFVGTPCWMAPEVMAQLYGYDFKADIWSFGITALELAHGHAPFSKHPPHKVLLMTLQNAPPGLDYERDKKFSKSFRQMIAMCLVKEPSMRPSAQKLLKHPFFKHAKSSESVVRTLLEGLPTLGERLESLKMKEAKLLAQKKISDGKKEEMSQNEYKRGISDWNFNMDDLKEEASLIHHVEEMIPETDQGSSSVSLFGLDTEKTPFQCPPSAVSHCLMDDHADKEDGDALQNKAAAFTLGGLTVKDLKDRCIGYENNLSIPVSSHIENNLQQQNVRKGGSSGTNLHDLAPSQVEVTSDKQRIPVPAVMGPNAVGAASTKLPVSKGDELDKKLEGQVFKQLGRFTVISDDVNVEKEISHDKEKELLLELTEFR